MLQLPASSLAFALAGSLAAALSGCGGTETGSGGPSSGSGGGTTTSVGSTGVGDTVGSTATGAGGQGTGGAGAAGGTGSGGATSCDALDTCGDLGSGCIACAYSGPCSLQADLCSQDQDCAGYQTCIDACMKWDNECLAGCAEAHETGASAYQDLYECAICQQCPTACAEPAMACEPL